MTSGIVIFFACLGMISGLLGGLIGIGGGPVIVPGLAFIFSFILKFPSQYVMHYAIASSLGAIFITITAAVFVHNREGDVRWQTTRDMVVFVVIGVTSGAFFATLIASKWLALSFALFVWLPIYKMLSVKKLPQHKLEGNLVLKTVGPLGYFSGLMSGLLGIGGGIFTVPLLCYLGMPINKATGTSLSLGLFSTLAGTITFLLLEPKLSTHIPGSVGFVYLPALLCVGIPACIFSPIGVKLAKILPNQLIRKIFCVFLILVSIKMFVMFAIAEGAF